MFANLIYFDKVYYLGTCPLSPGPILGQASYLKIIIFKVIIDV